MEVFVAPVGKDGFAVVLAVAGGAAGVGEEDGVPVGGVELGQMGELGVVGPDGAAVGDKQSGIFFAGDVIKRLVEVAGDLGAVFGFEVDVFAVGEPELGEEGVVDVGDLGEFAVDDCVDFVGAVDGGHLDGDGACRRDVAGRA